MKITTEFKYDRYRFLLDDKYDLSTAILLPHSTNVFSSFQYKPLDNKIDRIVKSYSEEHRAIRAMVPEDFISALKIILEESLDEETLDEMALDEAEITGNDNIYYCSLAWITKDKTPDGELEYPVIVFDFNKIEPGCKISAKITFIDNKYAVCVVRRPLITDNKFTDVEKSCEPINFKVIIYKITDDCTERNYNKPIFISSISTWYSNSFSIPVNLDSNHVIFEVSSSISEHDDSGKNIMMKIQNLSIIRELDYARISSLWHDEKSLIPKDNFDILYIGNDAVGTYKSCINYDQISNCKVYDLFGNPMLFKDYKNNILNQTNIR